MENNNSTHGRDSFCLLCQDKSSELKQDGDSSSSSSGETAQSLKNLFRYLNVDVSKIPPPPPLTMGQSSDVGVLEAGVKGRNCMEEVIASTLCDNCASLANMFGGIFQDFELALHLMQQCILVLDGRLKTGIGSKSSSSRGGGGGEEDLVHSLLKVEILQKCELKLSRDPGDPSLEIMEHGNDAAPPPPVPGNQSSMEAEEEVPPLVANENARESSNANAVSAGSPVPPEISASIPQEIHSSSVVTSGSDLPPTRDSPVVQGPNTNAEKPLFSSSSSSPTSTSVMSNEKGINKTCDALSNSISTPDVIEVPTVQTKYMRRHQAAKSAFLNNRDYFREVDVKPPFSYPFLIGQAIGESPKKLLTSYAIVAWLKTHFRYFKDPTRGNLLSKRIQSALTIAKCFTSVGVGWKVNQKEFYSHRQKWTRPKELNSFVRQRRLESGGSSRLSCLHCETTLCSKVSLKTHMISVHPLIHYAASIPAGTTTTTEDMLEAAINRVIRRAKMDGGRQFYCGLCFKVGGVSKRTHVLKCHFEEVARALSK